VKHSPRSFGTPSGFPQSIHRGMRPKSIPHMKRLAVLAAILLWASGTWAATKYKVLYSFQGGNDGANPVGGLTLDAAGNLYGVTANGGNENQMCWSDFGTGCGIAFKLTPSATSWSKSLLYTFCSQNNCADGALPHGDLFDSGGALYGTTLYGGDCSYADGCGTAFALTPDSEGHWRHAVLYEFQGYSDAVYPDGGLVSDLKGNLYGTAGGYMLPPVGTVFVLTPHSGKWAEKVIYTFCSGCGDGGDPAAALVRGLGGDLYGVTSYGGQDSFACPSGCGVLFKLTQNSKDEWREGVLRTLVGADGASPGTLISDSRGSLYGTTTSDGAFGAGTVFRLTQSPTGDWKYTVLYEFRTSPVGSALVLDTKGNLYGAGSTGGSGNCNYVGCGLIYKLAAGAHDRWKYVDLYDFTGGSDGGWPSGPLTIDKNGTLYGVAEVGGDNQNGVVFEVTP